MSIKSYLSVFAAIALLAVGAATVSASSDDQPIIPAQADAAVTSSIAAFRSPSASSEPTGQLAAVVEQGAPAGENVAKLDVSRARSVAVEGTQRRAWIAPAGDHVCLFVPAEPFGYGASCPSIEDIKAGRAVVINAPEPGSGNNTLIVGSIVPDGMTAPAVGARSLETANNIAVGRVNASGELTTKAGPINLGSFKAAPSAANPAVR